MKSTANTIEKIHKKLEQKRTELENGQLNAMRELLSNQTIEKLCEECQYFFRKRLFSPIVIIFHMIGAAVSRDGSFQSSWHHVGQTGASYQLAKGRKRVPLRLWQSIATWIVEQINTLFAKKQLWKGHRVVSPDGTCVSMPDTEALTKSFGKPGEGDRQSTFPLARIVFVFTLKTFITIEHAIAQYASSEKELFLQLLKKLLPGDLIVADSGFAGANLYHYYTHAGMDYITRMHHHLQIERLRILKKISTNDLIVVLPIKASHRRKDPSLPKAINARIIRTKRTVKGKSESFWLVTSLMEPKKYPARQIALLYTRRWKAETLIEQIKIWLGADILRSKTPAQIKKELYARVIACNLLHWLMLKAAQKHKTSIEQISVSATIRLVSTYSAKMSEAPLQRLHNLYDELLEKIAASQIPYRPDRIEPRAQKRNKKKYPKLKLSRKQWRLINGFAA